MNTIYTALMQGQSGALIQGNHSEASHLESLEVSFEEVRLMPPYLGILGLRNVRGRSTHLDLSHISDPQ